MYHKIAKNELLRCRCLQDGLEKYVENSRVTKNVCCSKWNDGLLIHIDSVKSYFHQLPEKLQ